MNPARHGHKGAMIRRKEESRKGSSLRLTYIDRFLNLFFFLIIGLLIFFSIIRFRAISQTET
jgi:hypothetical protein